MPFQIVSGGTRITLSARFEAPRETNGVWAVDLGGGSAVLAPVDPTGEPLVLLVQLTVLASIAGGSHIGASHTITHHDICDATENE